MMEGNDKILCINDKKKMYYLLVVINMIISIGLTLTGTVSIVYFIMFLYEIFNISMLECFALDIILPYVYSCCANSFIKKIDIKTKDISKEIDKLEKEYEIEQIIDDIRIRFNDLSRDKQIELLNYVKNNYLYMVSGFENISKLDDNEILMLINNMDSVKLIEGKDVYSKKRVRI